MVIHPDDEGSTEPDHAPPDTPHTGLTTSIQTPLGEPAHPHGVVGYVLADSERTRNAVLLAHWMVPTAILVVAIIAGALVGLALFSPLAAAGLLGGGSTATAGSLAVCRWRRLRDNKGAAKP